MDEHTVAGTPAAPGIALGEVWWHGGGTPGPSPSRGGDPRSEADHALAALGRAAEELIDVAARLPPEEAEIVETGVLMGQDPALLAAVEAAALTDGLPAADAIMQAASAHAEAIAAIGDETLAARADDVRSLARRAARLASGQEQARPSRDGVVLMARDLGPGDVAELASSLAGIALVAGGSTAHAAIVARSLGLPMVTGLGSAVFDVPDGTAVVVDGTAGTVAFAPSADRARSAHQEVTARAHAERRASEARDLPAVTTDGIRVAVLTNVSSAEEYTVATRAGAEGIGLVRTELAFLAARTWPDEEHHAAMLTPILAELGERPAVVRVLDFGVDKSPPFLAGTAARGLELLLAHPDALSAQLRAIARFATEADVRVLLPMVQGPNQVVAARALLDRAARSVGLSDGLPVGAMIETPAAAQNAAAIASVADFLSIGTNDLTSSVLKVDRFDTGAAVAHDPRVLRAIASSVVAAHDADIAIEVCGEAASEPIMVPLLVGLGVDELSVGAARVADVRRWIRALDAREAAGMARSALTMDSAGEVLATVRPLADALLDASDRRPEPQTLSG